MSQTGIGGVGFGLALQAQDKAKKETIGEELKKIEEGFLEGDYSKGLVKLISLASRELVKSEKLLPKQLRQEFESRFLKIIKNSIGAKSLIDARKSQLNGEENSELNQLLKDTERSFNENGLYKAEGFFLDKLNSIFKQKGLDSSPLGRAVSDRMSERTSDGSEAKNLVDAIGSGVKSLMTVLGKENVKQFELGLLEAFSQNLDNARTQELVQLFADARLEQIENERKVADNAAANASLAFLDFGGGQ